MAFLRITPWDGASSGPGFPLSSAVTLIWTAISTPGSSGSASTESTAFGPNISHAAIAEGMEYFHIPITYSAQCHMMEMRWRKGGEEAWGSILNFLEHQKSDGSLHGRIYPNHLSGTDYYHANWGRRRTGSFRPSS